jgi:predicted DNA-binding transcriptional regulator YafY
MKDFDEFDYWSRSPEKNVNLNSLLTNEVGKKLVQAVNQKLKAEIEYDDGNETKTKRIIEPYGLFERLGNNYVQSYCYLRQDFRTFRIDRIKTIEVINSPHEKKSPSTPIYSPVYSATPQTSVESKIPGWLLIVGFILLLYFCSKFK